MAQKFQEKFSSILLATIIGVLVLSFALSGFLGDRIGFQASQNAVATVSGTPILIREYRQAIDRLSYVFSGGKNNLSAKQIKELNLSQRALSLLIDETVFLNFADELKLGASTDELKQQIKESPYFSTEGQFDLARYKRLGSLTKDYEESLKKSLKSSMGRKTLSSYLISSQFKAEIERFKQDQREVDFITMPKTEKDQGILLKKLEEHLKSGSKKKIEALKKEHNFTDGYDTYINKYDGKLSFNQLSPEDTLKLFMAESGTLHTFDTSASVTLVKVKKSLKNEKEVVSVDQLKSIFSRKYLDLLKKKSQIKVNQALL